MEIRWLEAARFDIDEIYSHIEADDPRAADKVFGRMIAAVQALGDLPHRGRPGRWPGTRELVVPRTCKAVEKADAGGPFVSHDDAARYLKTLAQEQNPSGRASRGWRSARSTTRSSSR